MGLLSDYQTLRVVLKYSDLPPTGNSGDRILIASIGRLANWNGSSWDVSAHVDSDLPANAVQDSNGLLLGASGIVLNKYVDVTVSAAEMLALNATPKQLVAAPAAGYWNVLRRIQMFLDYGTVAYAGIAAGEDLAVRYTNGSGQIAATVETTGFLDATADAHRLCSPSDSVAITPVAAAALVLHMTAGEITTGDSPLKCRVFYDILPALT